jgi:predicted nucleic-acid-binding Zn-ribbon protein
MNTYVVIFIPRCYYDAEHSVEDVQIIISKADNKIDLITKLIRIENNSFINFVCRFIAYSEEIPEPYFEEIKSHEILKKIKQEYDEQDIANGFSDEKESIEYVKKNIDDIVYLIQLYENEGCDYIRIDNFDDVYV